MILKKSEQLFNFKIVHRSVVFIKLKEVVGSKLRVFASFIEE